MLSNHILWLTPALALLVAGSPALARTAMPGTVNYLEGQVSVDGHPIGSKAVGSTQVGENQVLETRRGRAEMLLTPGVFLRVGDDSAVRFTSASLSDTRIELVRGEAMVEVAQLYKENNLGVLMDGSQTTLQKQGLYNFDAGRAQVRVFDGQALVAKNDQQVELKKGHEALLAGPTLQAVKFDRDAAHDSLYAWSKLRSQYEAEASLQAARTVVVGGPGWYGPGWYWNPWWGMYGFVPGSGILYSPFGSPYYSPVVIYRRPIIYGRPLVPRVAVPRPAPAFRGARR